MELPAALTELNHWVLWKEEPKGDRLTKMPYYIVNGTPCWASSTNSATWTSFARAVEQCKTYNMSGIGFCFEGSGFAGIDFDGCRDPETGLIDDWALAEIRKLNSYSEVSPSRTGVKVFVRGRLPGPGTKAESGETGHGGKRRAIELYDGGRYFAVTGQVLAELPDSIESRDLTGLYNKVKKTAAKSAPKPASTASGQKVSSGGRHKFLLSHGGRLLRDGISREGLEAEFLRINREMFAEPKPEDEIRTQARDMFQRYQTAPGVAPEIASANRVLVTRRATDIKPEELIYLWPRYLPANKLVGIYGNSAEGKSPVAIDLIARVTSGAAWPDETRNELGPRSVLLMASEDGEEDVIIPRFLLAGGDTEKLHLIQGSKRSDDVADSEDVLALDRDIQALRAKVAEIPDLSLIVIDPILNHLGAQDPKLEQQVRANVLMPLTELGVCVILIGHFNKSAPGTIAQNRVAHCKAFYGVPRFVYMVGPDPAFADRFSHVMVQDRGCAAPALRYQTIAETLKHDGKEIPDVVRVRWLGSSTASGQDVVDPLSAEQKSVEVELADTLREFIGNSPRPASECLEYLGKHGFDPKLHNAQRIRDHAGIDSTGRGRNSKWSPKPQLTTTKTKPEPAVQNDGDWEAL